MSRRHAVWIAGSFALAVCLSLSGFAKTTKTKEPPWVAMDWTKWSSWDCQNVLRSSPWVQGGVRLESALPIREAHLRELQLQKNYGWMNAEKKKAFDEEHILDLSEDDGGQVVIWSTGEIWAGPTFLDRESLPARQAAVRLPDGSLLMPIKTTLSGDVIEHEIIYASGHGTEFHVASIAEYVFPRTVNGKPIFTEQDGMIWFFFGDVLPYKGKTEILGPQKAEDFHQGIGFDFPTATLMYKGKLEY